MNILFVHEVNWSTKVVYELHGLSELLSSFGHNVFMIDFVGLQRHGSSDFISLKTEEITRKGRAHCGSSITLVRPGLIKAPFLDRASAFLTHYLAIEGIVRNRKIDVIVLYSVPTNGFSVITIAKKYHIPVVFRSIDILHKLVPSKIFLPLTFSTETWVYKHVDKILTLSPKLSDYVKRLDADENKVDLLLLGVDLNKFNPHVNSEGFRKKWGIAEDDLVIVYIGTLFDFSGLDIYLNQFSQVIDEIPKVKLVIVGGGALLRKLEEIISRLGLSENVLLTGFQPFDMMPQFVSISDLCVNPFIINDVTRDIMPSKIIQYLACGKPVLATPLPGMTSLISGSKQGVVYSDISNFDKSTINLLKNGNALKEIGEYGYRYVKDFHDEEKIARKLELELIKLTQKRRIIND